MFTKETIQAKLKSLGVSPDKYLGQHFLIDRTLLDAIAAESSQWLNKDDVVVEVGPGLGVLTDQLVATGNKVMAVERDPVLAQKLSGANNLTVIQADVLQQLDQPDTQLHQELGSGSWTVVANIPYAITSPLLRKLARESCPPHHILVLVQKESAERIAAQPGDSRRGLLTVELELNYESKLVRLVPPASFWPAPEVDSALLVLEQRPEPLVPPEAQKKFLSVVIAGFAGKRKQLGNSLSGGLRRSAGEVRELLRQCGIDPQRRAETLTVAEWYLLSRAI